MGDDDDSLYKFFSHIFKLTGYGDFNERGFTARWLKANNSLAQSSCINYLKNYISSENCVTVAQLLEYQKVKKDKSIDFDNVDEKLAEYFDPKGEHFVDLNDDILSSLEGELIAAERYLDQLNIVEQSLRDELKETDNEMAQYAGGPKSSIESTDIKEINKLYNEVICSLYESVESLSDTIADKSKEKFEIDVDKVEQMNHDVEQNIKFLLKKEFSEIPETGEFICDDAMHTKVASLGLDLSSSKCKRAKCIPRDIIDLKELCYNKKEVEYGEYLLKLREEETLACLEEMKNFVKNASEDTLFLTSSEMRLITRDNNDKIVMLKNMTKDYYKYTEEHFDATNDLFTEILNEKMSFVKNANEFFIALLNELAGTTLNHASLNKARIFFDFIKNEKYRSAVRLYDKANDILNNLYEEHMINMDTLEKKKNQFSFSKKNELEKLQQLADLCGVQATIDETCGLNDVLSELRKMESDVNRFFFVESPGERMNEICLLKRNKEKMFKLIFNGPLMQPTNVDLNLYRWKEKIKSKLIELMKVLSIVQHDFSDGMENSADFSAVIARSLWTMFLADPDKMIELYSNLDLQLFKK